jgi:DNA replication protein DnaC
VHLTERITLSPGETKEERFGAWLLEKAASSHFCAHHVQTKLVACRSSQDIRPVEKEHKYYDPFWKVEFEPNVFDFKVSLRCPACQCAYALCPREFHNTPLATFETSTPEQAKALDLARHFISQVDRRRRGWALLVGPPGTGKTHLACGVVSELDNREALYVRLATLTCELRASYGRKVVTVRMGTSTGNDSDNETRGPLELTKVVPFLVLDEIGCNQLAADERVMLDELLRHRYDHRKPSILISNLPLDELKSFLGDALIDRIRHASGNGRFIMQFFGASYRRSSGEAYL